MHGHEGDVVRARLDFVGVCHERHLLQKPRGRLVFGALQVFFDGVHEFADVGGACLGFRIVVALEIFQVAGRFQNLVRHLHGV